MSAEPASVMAKLDGYAGELDKRSKELADSERKLEPLETFFEEFLDDFETSCWEAHVKEDEKLPSEAMRLRLARKAMPSEVLTEHASCLARRKRLQRRIKDLEGCIDAQRSLLSALKQEAEASGNTLRAA